MPTSHPGYYDTVEEYDAARRPIEAWIAAALADGWTSRPTYGDGHEAESRARTLVHVDGWKASVYLRTPEERGLRWHAELTLWGPDGLAVDVAIAGPSYSMEILRGCLRVCGDCGATNVDTRRVAFCNRVCDACRPAAKARLETPGWCD